MNQYNVTAKLWIKIEATSSKQAHDLSKTIIDEALYEYVNANRRPDVQITISKSKIIWESTQKKGSTYALQASVYSRYADRSKVSGDLPPIQKKLLKLVQKEDIGLLTLREIGRRIGVDHPQTVKYHLLKLQGAE